MPMTPRSATEVTVHSPNADRGFPRASIWFVIIIAISIWPQPAAAQDLSGSYVYASPQGPVTLTLQQDAQGRVAGRLGGTDGSVMQLTGVVQGGRATGQISVGGGTGWFAVGFDGPRLLLLVAELDPATGQPDLSQSWNLEFTPAGAAGRPVVPTPAVPGMLAPRAPPAAAAPQAPAAAGQPDPFGRPDESQLAREWRDMLRGAKLTRISSYSSGTAGGGGYSEHWEAFACSDGTLHFRDNSVTSYGDVGAFSARQGGATGRWQVITQGDRAFLASQFEGQPVGYGELTFDPGQRATFVDGNRFYITRRDNDVCP
jgi:hypothetical protein